MKKELRNSLIFGSVLFAFFGLYGGFYGLGLRGLPFVDGILAFGSLIGMLCAYIAYKKHKHPQYAFFAGFFFGLLALIYYSVAKPGMTEKEKELHEWKMKKEYQQMLEEKAKQQ